MDPQSSSLNIAYFESLRSRIDVRLDELQTRHRDEQRRHRWLYGALGAVPSDVMFICLNPSLTGIRNAAVDTVDGGPPDVEAQWWGGKNDNAANVFRVALHDLGLKLTPPNRKGGWNCYITNVVKEANFTGAEQRKLSTSSCRAQAEAWASILKWEIEQVKPRVVFTMGEKALDAVQHLRKMGKLQLQCPLVKAIHYSAYGTPDSILARIRKEIQDGLSRAKR